MSDIRLQTPEKTRTFRDLLAYQKSKELVKIVYDLSNKFPKQNFALKNQIQRAVISVPANIAEGQERYSDKEGIRFLRIAKASLAEVEVYIDIASDLSYINQKDFEFIFNQIQEIGKLINGLIRYLLKSDN